jgi:hypothetical protein
VSLPPTTEGQAWTYVRAVPVATSDVVAIRVRLDFADGLPPPALDEVSQVTRASPGPERSSDGGIAVGCPYSVEPDFPRAYPDRGGMLTDGEVATAGWSQGKSVGWYGTGATIVLDLGEGQPVDQIVVHCDGGGYGAVRFADAVLAAAFSGAESPSLRDAGLGPPPSAPAAIASAGPADVEIGWQRAVEEGPLDASGTLRLRLPGAPVRARWVCLSLAQPAWLMVSEIEVREGEVNRALGAAYHVLPRPAARTDVRYADDGRLLTDGYVAGTFSPPRVAGWADQAATVTVDLGSTRPIAEVGVHALGGGLYGIFAPRSVSVRVSADGREWLAAVSVEVADPGGSTAAHIVATVPVGATARFVQVTAEPSRGWLMLSEVEIRPGRGGG